MPRKIREFKRELKNLGFGWRPGKGRHQVWSHPRLAEVIVIARQDGADTPRYLENSVEVRHCPVKPVRSAMKPHYSMVIEWSEQDEAYVVSIPEFVGRVMMPCTEGDTYEDAARSGQEVVETFLEMWKEKGEPLPSPRGHVASAA